MEQNLRYFTGALVGVAGLLAHISSLVECAMLFVAIDFVSGVWADYFRQRRAGRRWRFESTKAWRTVRKAACIMAGIILAWLIDYVLLGIATLHLANIFTGFVCGVELWSFLENSYQVSYAKVFRKLRDILKKKLEGIKW